MTELEEIRAKLEAVSQKAEQNRTTLKGIKGDIYSYFDMRFEGEIRKVKGHLSNLEELDFKIKHRLSSIEPLLNVVYKLRRLKEAWKEKLPWKN